MPPANQLRAGVDTALPAAAIVASVEPFDAKARTAPGVHYVPGQRLLDLRKQEHGHDNYEATDNCHAGAPLEMLSSIPGALAYNPYTAIGVALAHHRQEIVVENCRPVPFFVKSIYLLCII